MSASTSTDTPSQDAIDGLREVVLELLEGVRRGYTHAEATAFLRRLARAGWIHAADGVSVVRELGDSVSIALDSRAETLDSKLLQILGAAGARIINLLRELAHTADSATFGQHALHLGWVRRAGSTWAPSAAPGLQLSEVFMGMVAADALTSPEVYDRDLSVCSQCGLVGFGARVSGRTSCDDHTLRTSERLRASARREGEPGDGTMARPSERRISLPIRTLGDDD